MNSVIENSTAACVEDMPMTTGAPKSPKNSTNGYGILWWLWDEREFIGRLAIVGVLAGVLLAFLIPPRYTARTQLMPPDASGSNMMGAMAAGMTDKAGGLGTAAANLLGVKSSGALFVGILKSRTVQDRLVDRFDLRKVYGVRYWYQARQELSDRTEVSEDRKSGLITLEIADGNRDRAQQLAQAYVEELNRVAANSAIASAGRERQFIEEQLVDVKKEMDQSAKALADFSTKNNTIDLKEQAKAMVDAIATVQGQLIQAQSELKGLQAIYTDSNIRVRSVQARIGELNRQLRELGGTSSGKGGDLASGYPSLRKLPDLGMTYEDLYRRNRIANAVYEALVQQYEMSKIQEAKDTPKVQMLDAPERPEVKSFPPRMLIVCACWLLSIVFAGVWIVAGEQWAGIANDNCGKLLLTEIASAVRGHRVWQNKLVRCVIRAGRSGGRVLAHIAQDRFTAHKPVPEAESVQSD